MDYIPEWLQELESEDIAFIKVFLMASGSLKDVAKHYDVTYPTVRLRLDRLIEKIQINDSQESDAYIRLVKRLAVEDTLDYETAKQLITAYRGIKGEK